MNVKSVISSGRSFNSRSRWATSDFREAIVLDRLNISSHSTMTSPTILTLVSADDGSPKWGVEVEGIVGEDMFNKESENFVMLNYR